MFVDTPCDSCKSIRVIVSKDNEGWYVICRGCLKTREDATESLNKFVNLLCSDTTATTIECE